MHERNLVIDYTAERKRDRGKGDAARLHTRPVEEVVEQLYLCVGGLEEHGVVMRERFGVQLCGVVHERLQGVALGQGGVLEVVRDDGEELVFRRIHLVQFAIAPTLQADQQHGQHKQDDKDRPDQDGREEDKPPIGLHGLVATVQAEDLRVVLLAFVADAILDHLSLVALSSHAVAAV